MPVRWSGGATNAEHALGDARSRAAEDRGVAMSLAAAAEYALLLTAPGITGSPRTGRRGPPPIPDSIGQLAGEHHRQMLAQAGHQQLRRQHDRQAVGPRIIRRLAAAIARIRVVTTQAFETEARS